MADLTNVIEIATASHSGMVRSHNEDSIAADAAVGLAVLADGMGVEQHGLGNGVRTDKPLIVRFFLAKIIRFVSFARLTLQFDFGELRTRF